MTSPRMGADAAPGRVPDVWGKIPPRNKNFTGRDELLNRLRAGITGNVTAVVPHALHGLGGVGKTQMAVEYAYRYRPEYDLVWWIPADQPVLVRSSLAGLAAHLGLPSAAASGIEDAANAVLDALRRGDPYSNWLLIFDNADQPEELIDSLPHGPGHVLITSRNHRWDGVVDTVAVDVFTRAESAEFLRKRVPRGVDKAEAERLADALGDLPLALEQAGALQAETGMSVEEYLRLLRERTSQLLAEGKPTEYPASMTAAWGLSVSALDRTLPEAIDLLRCCAFFGPEPIPRDLFSQPKASLGPRLTSLVADPIQLSRVIAELGRYALARLDNQSRTLQVHRLIQALLRDELPEDVKARIRHEVHLLMAGYAPANSENRLGWPRYFNLLGHIGPTELAGCQAPEVRTLALNMVRYLVVSGDYVSARALAEDFVERWAKDSGEDHYDVLNVHLELAIVLRELGEFGASAELSRRTKTIARRTLGPDDELTLRFLRGDGADMRAGGDFQAAKASDEEALRLHRGKFGDSDSRTLLALNNLALDYALSGDYVGSRRLHEEAYQAQLVLDPESSNPNRLLIAWSGLARAVRLCGDYLEACDFGEDAYAFGVEQLGAEHIWTLRTQRDLSIASRRSAEYDRALELASDVHARCLRIFGLDNPDTLASAMALSNIHRSMGNLEEAHELAADTVRRYPSVYGKDHPYHHGCVGNLAVLRRLMGDPVSARQLNETAINGLESKLGRDHHYTLTVALNLVSDLAALGKAEDAARLGEETLRRLRMSLGDEHPLASACAANLSLDYETLGRSEDAAALQERTEEVYRTTLGPDHPDARIFLERRRIDTDFDPAPV
ncbi:FxSxx-COOH system tetratricopeptide repeat protein [Spirillospora sp. NPDC048823]|uniref:FxSxx-COOH system tetratricopeptide repeat protein n=2 Tax=unclassified Spirillospora TaxID=2642701 RepID=UPI0037132D8B